MGTGHILLFPYQALPIFVQKFTYTVVGSRFFLCPAASESYCRYIIIFLLVYPLLDRF